ncbi:MAG TPA: YHS domain-containing protein [bacterium]|jgi:Cu+-exporting ATPase
MEARKTLDPVCGMEVDPLSAMYTATYKDETYYFCSASCKEKFQANPESFAGGGTFPKL